MNKIYLNGNAIVFEGSNIFATVNRSAFSYDLNGSVFEIVDSGKKQRFTLGTYTEFTDANNTVFATIDEAKTYLNTLFLKQVGGTDGTTFELLKVGSLIVEKNSVPTQTISEDGWFATRYRDEYPSGSWVDGTGGAAPDVVSLTVGNVTKNFIAFDGNNTEERKGNQFEIPHDCDVVNINLGILKIEVHGHMRPSTNNAGTAQMFFDWSYSPPNGAPIAMPSQTIDFVIAANKQYFNLLSGVELPIPAGGFNIGGIIDFNLRRTPSNVGDTYPNDLLFSQFAMHIPTDGTGSRQRYIK